MSEIEKILESLNVVQGKARAKTDEPKFYLVFDNSEIPAETVKRVVGIQKPIKLNEDGIRILEQYFGTRNRKVLAQRLVLYIMALSTKTQKKQ